MTIKHLSNREINKEKWDWCIRNAINGNIYAWSWYLDTVCPGWEALVSEDYHYVMPLTGRKKLGIPYLFRPLLNQQLGLFFTELPDPAIPDSFLDAIPGKYRLIEISLNKYHVPRIHSFEVGQHNCYALDLISDYDSLHSGYNQHTKRALNKAKKENLTLNLNISAEDYLELLWKDPGKGASILRKPKNLTLLHSLLEQMKNHQAGRILGIHNSSGELIAACLFGISHSKWYYLAPVSTSQARDSRALFQLVDHVIQINSGQSLTLDFEGSDLEGVARFYAGFGAKPYHYCSIRQNSLPWPVKLLKS